MNCGRSFRVSDQPSVVCNSGPLIALASVGQLAVLHNVYGEIIIPPGVFSEVMTPGGSRAGAQFLMEATWIRRIELDEKPDLFLMKELGLGEAEVIALACQINASQVLLDERRARRVAAGAYGLKVHGTLYTLAQAKKLGAVSEIRPILKAMQSSGYYLTDDLIDHACQEIGE